MKRTLILLCAAALSAADLNVMTGNLINIGLKRLNPANAATLTFVPTTVTGTRANCSRSTPPPARKL